MHSTLFPPLLTESDFSPAELSAACLDGDLFALDGGYACVAEPETRELRALALSGIVPRGAIAELQTALWVYGCIPRAPSPHRLCVNAREAIRAAPRAHVQFREVCLFDDEVQQISGISVTTPLRTLLDVARMGETCSPVTRHQLAELIRSCQLTLADVEQRFEIMPHLPHKKRALARLRSEFERCDVPADQPPLTRYTS